MWNEAVLLAHSFSPTKPVPQATYSQDGLYHKAYSHHCSVLCFDLDMVLLQSHVLLSMNTLQVTCSSDVQIMGCPCYFGSTIRNILESAH